MLLPMLTFAIEGYQNVIFQERDKISLTRAMWLVTFAIDLTPYDRAFKFLEESIKDVQTRAKEDFPQEFLGDTTFEALVNNVNGEFLEVKTKRQKLLNKYKDYRSMEGRSKRAILPFVGDALSYLFGITSEKDLKVVQEAVKELDKTQAHMLHIVKDSISIVNLTRHEVRDNREKINELIEGLRSIVPSVANETKGLGRRVSRLEILTHRYWLYKMLVDRLRDYFLTFTCR